MKDSELTPLAYFTSDDGAKEFEDFLHSLVKGG
jgi:hypothetical protein